MLAMRKAKRTRISDDLFQPWKALNPKEARSDERLMLIRFVLSWRQPRPERLCLVTCLLLSATLTGSGSSNNYILAA